MERLEFCDGCLREAANGVPFWSLVAGLVVEGGTSGDYLANFRPSGVLRQLSFAPARLVFPGINVFTAANEWSMKGGCEGYFSNPRISHNEMSPYLLGLST